MGGAAQWLAKSRDLDVVEALAAATTAAWRWEIGAPMVTWSPDASIVLGIPEIVLRSPDLLLKAVHPADLSLVSRPATDSWATGGPVSTRFRITLADEVRWFEAAGRIVRDDGKRPAYATGTAREVTETREAEEAIFDALREAEAVLGQLGAGVGEWDLTTDLIRVFTGPTGLGRKARTPGQVPLQTVLLNMDDLGRSRLRAALPRAANDGEPFTIEMRMSDADGEVRRLMVKGGPSPSSTGRVRLVALVLE